MTAPTLSVSLLSDRLTLPVLNGAVTFEGFALQSNAATSVDRNSRQMLEGRYDVAEMSLATFVRARLDGAPLIALPAFTGRRFLHAAVVCAPASGVRRLEQLEGKRVAVPQYWMTSSVWHRGILHEFYGVPQDRIYWVTTSDERLTTLLFPQGVTVERAPDGATPLDLLTAGRVDGAMLPKRMPPSADYISPFADLAAAEADYYTRARVFPIMHLVVASERILSRHPGLARALMDLFARAKRLADAERGAGDAPGADRWAYGVEPNRRALETFLGYAAAQGLIDRPLRPEALFAEVA